MTKVEMFTVLPRNRAEKDLRLTFNPKLSPLYSTEDDFRRLCMEARRGEVDIDQTSMRDGERGKTVEGDSRALTVFCR